MLRRAEREHPRAYGRVVERLEVSERGGRERARPCAMAIPHDDVTGINLQDAQFLDREVWDLKNTPAGQAPVVAALPPAGDLSLPGAQGRPTCAGAELQGDHFSLNRSGSTSTTTTRSPPVTSSSVRGRSVDHRRRGGLSRSRACATSAQHLCRPARPCTAIPSTGCTWHRRVGLNSRCTGSGGMRDSQRRVITSDPRLP